MKRSTGPLIGNGIISLVTVGLYDDPLAVYREYIQNAADAFAASGRSGGHVHVLIDPAGARLRIRDYGPGLSYSESVRRLLPIARSDKIPGDDRGFRGIGRLAALAFAESVAFVTRSRSDTSVTRVVWDGVKLRERLLRGDTVETAIRDSVDIGTDAGDDYPDHFFDVEVAGVARHFASVILNRERVRDYIGEVCPVPMSTEFPFVSSIDTVFAETASPLELRVTLEGETAPVTRRYGGGIVFSSGREDEFRDFEAIRIPSADGNRLAALGWIAHSSYVGVIPKGMGVRGIRVRAGNIQVGDESVFDSLFPEDRFNRWCVGEIHVLDSRILTNARRDYFEPGPHVRNLENRLGEVVRSIMRRCRAASASRNRARKFLSELSQLEDVYDLAVSGYLSSSDSNTIVAEARDRITRMQKDAIEDDHRKLEAMEIRFRSCLVSDDCSRLKGFTSLEVSAYHNVFRALAAVSSSPRAAREVMEAVVGHSR